MVDAQVLAELTEVEHPDILSVSLDVDPTKPEHQTPNPAYRIWAHEAIREILAGLSDAARAKAARAAREVLAHLEKGPVPGRGVMIFAGPGVWHVFVLPFPLPRRVQYGYPDVFPVLWAMSEYTAYATVIVRKGYARIVVTYLGGTVAVGEETLELDTSDWRFKAGRPDTYVRRVGIGVGRGAQADTFDARVDEQYRRFWRQVAQATAHALAGLHVERVILGGPEEATAALRPLLPAEVQRRIIGLVPIPVHVTLADIRDRTLPLALAEHHRRESGLVATVVARTADGRGTSGRAATLGALSQGAVETLIADRDLAGDIWACRRCAYGSATSVAVCPFCGRTIEPLPLRQALPVMALRHGAGLELVGPPAAAGLPEGVGALLRYTPAPAARGQA